MNEILSKCVIRELARIHSEEYFERKKEQESQDKKKKNILYIIYQWLIKDL